ncbi:MAG: ATP-binding protein [Gaiellaceae bacterium]
MKIDGGGSNERLSTELRAFYELARVVAAGPYHVGEILDRICTEVRTGFGFDRALLVRFDAAERTVHAVVQQNIDWPGDQWLDMEKFPFLERALEKRRAVFVQDASAERAVPGKIIERFGVRSIVAVPLVADERCLGFIVADRHGGAFELPESDLQLLSTLGWVAAVFVEKADQYAELERALEELRTLDQAKSDFVSIASHELRTPIAVVHGIASTLHLRGDELRGDQLHELRATMFEQTTRLAALAQGLLDLSRIEAGAVEPTEERFRPRERFETLLPQLVPDRLDDVHLTVAPELELRTDPHSVERIIGNLVINALRYGLPPVEVRTETDDRFRLVVEDCGEGVDPAFVPRLFDRFSRAAQPRPATGPKSGGAGLGLAIARSYAQGLGGDLVYERASPCGARFALILPREAVVV